MPYNILYSSICLPPKCPLSAIFRRCARLCFACHPFCLSCAVFWIGFNPAEVAVASLHGAPPANWFDYLQSLSLCLRRSGNQIIKRSRSRPNGPSTKLWQYPVLILSQSFPSLFPSTSYMSHYAFVQCAWQRAFSIIPCIRSSPLAHLAACLFACLPVCLLASTRQSMHLCHLLSYSASLPVPSCLFLSRRYLNRSVPSTLSTQLTPTHHSITFTLLVY